MRLRYAVILALVATLAAVVASADPNPGTYNSPFRGGNVLTGRVSVWRPTVNSGFPKVFLGQSWNGSALATQWEIRCGQEATGQAPNTSGYNAGTGTGVIVYTQSFMGGTFALYNDPSVGWGSGSGTLNSTTVITQVQFISFVPVSSSFTAVTSGQFDIGCTLDFAMSNGFGVGETPYASKPADYPVFLDGTCAPASALQQFGTWGQTNDIVVRINADCATGAQRATWGRIKTLYR